MPWKIKLPFLVCCFCWLVVALALPAQDSTSVVGVWAGQMTVGSEPSDVRMIFLRDPFGGFSGAVAFRKGSEAPQSGRAEVRGGRGPQVISVAFNSGVKAEFTARSQGVDALVGDVRISATGSTSERVGKFDLARESSTGDLGRLLTFTTGAGAVYLRRSDARKSALAPRPLQRAFSASEFSEAKEVAKGMVLGEVGTAMTVKAGSSIMTSGIAGAGYFGAAAALAGTALTVMRIGGPKEVRGFEFEFVRGEQSQVAIEAGALEIVLALQSFLPGESVISDIRPVLLRLDVTGKDHVRMVTTRAVSLKPTKRVRGDTDEGAERTEASVQQVVIQSDIEQKNATYFVLHPKSPLPVGEYAVVIFTKSSKGMYTENIPLKTEWTAEEVAKLRDMGQEWSGYGALAWDFRITK